jgi:hypothetical protein
MKPSKKYEDINWCELVEYSENSPSGLIWKVKRGTKIKPGMTVGHIQRINGRNYEYWTFRHGNKMYNVHRVIYKLVGDNYDNNGILTHRAGFDITLSAPKSLSIMALLGGDERLKDALVEANKEVMEYAEKHFAQGRIWNPELKMQEKVNTENLLVAQYLHSTSRSVDGQTPDPQLHIHNFVSNITLTEQGYKALEPRELYKHQNLLGQIAQNSMAEKVEKLGYQVEWTRQKKRQLHL